MVDEDDSDVKQSAVDRFQEIMYTISELAQEAVDLLPEHAVAAAKSYWYPHILCAIGDSYHDYLGGSMCSMEDSLETLQ
jgi:hypothetical protein